MRLLHPETLRIVATVCLDSDFEKSTSSRKQVVSHTWSECLKFKGSGKSHSKMFISEDYDLGVYMRMVYQYGKIIGCNLDSSHLDKYEDIKKGFDAGMEAYIRLKEYFDNNYLFSDATSLYFKGLNIFKYIFDNNWKKYVPVENLEEIKRQIEKSLNK